jgi:hypothetical protein
MSQANKIEMVDKAMSDIISFLADIFFREVPLETTTKTMWAKLEPLYMIKSLAHKKFLKQNLYSFRMVE